MAIGIVDLDLIVDKNRYRPNIDTMQISAYHKMAGDRVKLALSLLPEDLGWLSKLYVIYNGKKSLSHCRILDDDRVTLLGSYFFGTYCNLPDEIKQIYPDRSVYDKILSIKYFSNQRAQKIRGDLKKCDFIRLHEPSNRSFLSEKSESVYLYDTDITEQDYDEICSINKKIYLFYPIRVRTLAQAKKWLDANISSKYRTNVNFIAENFTETDLLKLLELPTKQRSSFHIKMGSCSEEYYPIELKKFLVFARKSRLITDSCDRPKLLLNDIKNEDYNYFFKAIKTWYDKKGNEDTNIFMEQFKTRKQYDAISRLKATNFDLYKLFTSVITKEELDGQS